MLWAPPCFLLQHLHIVLGTCSPRVACDDFTTRHTLTTLTESLSPPRHRSLPSFQKVPPHPRPVQSTLMSKTGVPYVEICHFNSHKQKNTQHSIAKPFLQHFSKAILKASFFYKSTGSRKNNINVGNPRAREHVLAELNRKWIWLQKHSLSVGVSVHYHSTCRAAGNWSQGRAHRSISLRLQTSRGSKARRGMQSQRPISWILLYTLRGNVKWQSKRPLGTKGM